MLGIGLLAWAAGEAYYSLFLDRLDSPPVPSVSDGLWLAFYPACYVAIVLLVRERVRQFRSSLWLDGVRGRARASAIAAALIFGHGRRRWRGQLRDRGRPRVRDRGPAAARLRRGGVRPDRLAARPRAPAARGGARHERDRRRLVPVHPRHRAGRRDHAGRDPLAGLSAADRLCGVAAAGGGAADPARGLARPADAVGVCRVRPRAARLPHDRASERRWRWCWRWRHWLP